MRASVVLPALFEMGSLTEPILPAGQNDWPANPKDPAVLVSPVLGFPCAVLTFFLDTENVHEGLSACASNILEQNWS